MKNTIFAKLVIIPTIFLCLIFISGCEDGKVARECDQISAKYEKLMDDGKTTPEQDKAFIKAISAAAYQLDRSVNGTKAALKSRTDALGGPLDLGGNLKDIERLKSGK